MDERTSEPRRQRRFAKAVEVQLREPGSPHVLLDAASINVSENGVLMELSGPLEAVSGEDVSVTLVWDGGSFEAAATILRFDSPYRGDPARSAVALRLQKPIPAHLLVARA